MLATRVPFSSEVVFSQFESKDQSGPRADSALLMGKHSFPMIEARFIALVSEERTSGALAVRFLETTLCPGPVEAGNTRNGDGQRYSIV